MPSWDAAKVLDLVNESTCGITCVGYAPSKRRRCQIRLAAHNIQAAQAIWQILPSIAQDTARLEQQLEALAERLLCPRFHQDQNADCVAKWTVAINKHRVLLLLSVASKTVSAQSIPSSKSGVLAVSQSIRHNMVPARKLSIFADVPIKKEQASPTIKELGSDAETERSDDLYAQLVRERQEAHTREQRLRKQERQREEERQRQADEAARQEQLRERERQRQAAEDEERLRQALIDSERMRQKLEAMEQAYADQQRLAEEKIRHALEQQHLAEEREREAVEQARLAAEREAHAVKLSAEEQQQATQPQQSSVVQHAVARQCLVADAKKPEQLIAVPQLVASNSAELVPYRSTEKSNRWHIPTFLRPAWQRRTSDGALPTATIDQVLNEVHWPPGLGEWQALTHDRVENYLKTASAKEQKSLKAQLSQQLKAHHYRLLRAQHPWLAEVLHKTKLLRVTARVSESLLARRSKQDGNR